MTGTTSAQAADELAAADVDAIARRLDDAWEGRIAIEPLSRSEALSSPEQAYAIQARWSAIRAGRGDRIIGRKIGLTSTPMQEQMGVSEPDYGSIWSSRFFPARRGRAEVPAGIFLQPRAEGELAFLLGQPLRGGTVTALDVLAATEAVAVSVEIIDSRFENWQIRLVDTVADNASYGAMVLGPWIPALRYSDLRTVGMLLHHNGDSVVEGIGAAALGHPARSVAWLVNKLGALGIGLDAGDVVLSGSLGRSIPIQQGDVFQVAATGLDPLTVALT